MKHQQLFIHLNKRAMEATKVADLQFIMVNETLQLAHYRQAAFFNISSVDNQYKWRLLLVWLMLVKTHLMRFG